MRFPFSGSPCSWRFAALIALAPAALPHPSCAAQSPGPSGYHLEATWKIGGDGGWDYLCMDAAAHRLYVARQNRVQVIDTDTGELAGEVPGLDGAHGIALVPELGRGFATSGRANAVVAFDLKTLKPVGDPIPAGTKPDAILYEPYSKQVFAFNGGSDSASVIDPATCKVAATIDLGGGPEFAAADGKGSLFVNLEDKSQIAVIDARKNRVIKHWPLAPGQSPSGLSADAANGRLFSGCHNQLLEVVETGSGKVIASLPIGQGVDATAFDPGAGLAFSSNGDGTLTVIRNNAPGAPEVVENVATRRGARTMAVDPQTHAVYLASAQFEPAPSPAPGQPRVRPKIVPGTFVILKFGR